jgi:phenylalanyl-tRNA synthetase beta chain
MKLPIFWLLDYLDLNGASLADVTAAACARWDLKPNADVARTLGQLMTFAGFACEGCEGSGEEAVLELDVLANRPDGQCILGLAREAAAVLRVPLKPPLTELVESDPAAATLAKMRVEDAVLCPRYTARVIRSVKVGPSPEWLQKRLKALGLIPRNNIVDITNFICFELNQPLHAFDLNKLAGREIIVRRAKPGEAFKPLYDEVPPLTPETLVIADAERPVACAGVIGGAGCEVSPETTDILLEAAYFDPASTRRTCRRLKVGTDSSYRFERGIDLEAVAWASARAARLIVETTGGTIARGILDSNPAPREAKMVHLRHRRLEQLYGVPIPFQDALTHLTALGCVCTQEERMLKAEVRVPSWRRGDLEREADLIEEVARIHGYNHVHTTTAMSARIAPRSAMEVTTDRARDLLTALGYFETVTDTLVDPRWPAPAVWTAEKPLAMDPRSVLREDHSVLRNSLLVSMLSTACLNQDRRAGEVRIFECGKVFLPVKGQARPDERATLGVLDERGFAVLADAAQRLPEALELDGAKVEWEPCTESQVPTFLAADKACRVCLMRGAERVAVGWLGLVAPALAQTFDLKKAPAIFEIDLKTVSAVPVAPRRYVPLPTQPENARDIAMVVDEGVTWGEVEKFAAAHQEPLRDRAEAPRFLSAFRGKQLGAGKKSLAFSVVYRHAERSLTDEEVNAAHQRFVEVLLKQFKATLRA